MARLLRGCSLRFAMTVLELTSAQGSPLHETLSEARRRLREGCFMVASGVRDTQASNQSRQT